MSVAFVSSLIEGTGNKTTAERISSYLQDEGITVYLRDIDEFENEKHFHQFLAQNGIKAVIGIHLVKAGKLLVDLNIPYIIIAGGTDLNIQITDPNSMSLMTKVVNRASSVITFTRCAHQTASTMWPLMTSKLVQQPQAVHATPSPFTFADLFKQFKVQPDVSFENMKVFLIIGGIRPVKAPLYTAEVFSKMHDEDPSICLIIIGPELCKHYTAQCRERLTNLKGVYMFPALPSSKVFSLMVQSLALVNSSESEGMCGAILEAMYLGTPVIARDNEGNLSIINDGYNGLIYSNVEEFVSKMKLLENDSSLRRRLIENGKTYVRTHHSAQKERETYVRLIKSVLLP